MAFDSSLVLGEETLPTGWKIVKGHDVAIINRSQIGRNDAPQRLKYIDISSVGTRKMAEPLPMFFEEAPSRARRRVTAGDTLISTVRPNLKHFIYLASPGKDWIASTGFAVVSPRNNVDPRYLYYYLTCDPFTDYLTLVADGAAYPAFNPSEISDANILLPPLGEQRAVAHALGSLDDKIELNRNMNESLEAVARAIFKSWFVDFDPVRAKTEGRKPEGMDAETATLFPKEFMDSELGEIPKGWEIKTMGTLLSMAREGINPGDYPNEKFDHYSIPAFDEGRTPTIETGETIKSNKFVVPITAVLLSKLNPHIPRVWFPLVGDERRSVCSTEYLVATPNEPASREYLYSVLCSQPFQEEFTSLVTGTSSSHQRVLPEDFLGMATVVPRQALVKKYTEVVGPILKVVVRNLKQNLALSRTRDSLLPVLLSGEIRLKGA